MNKAEIEGIVEEIWEDKKNLKVRVLTASGEGRNGPWNEWSIANFYGERSQAEVQGVVKGQKVRISGKITAFCYNDRWYVNFQAERLVVAAKHQERTAGGEDEDPGPGDDDEPNF